MVKRFLWTLWQTIKPEGSALERAILAKPTDPALPAMLSPSSFLAVSLVVAISIVRFATLSDPLGDPGWPTPLSLLGSSATVFILSQFIWWPTAFAVFPTTFAVFGHTHRVLPALRTVAYVAGSWAIITALLTAFSAQTGFFAYPDWLLSVLWGSLLCWQTRPLGGGKVVWAAVLLTISAVAAASWLDHRQYGRYTRITFWNIPSDSMSPTLHVDDLVVSDGWPAPLEKTQRGDIAVMRSPRGYFVILRIIGLPGDRVQYRNSRLWLNGAEVPRADLGEATIGKPAERPARIIQETIDGRSYLTLDLVPNAWTDSTEEFAVSPGHFFALGDNRDNSFDSRVSQQRHGTGMVPFEAVVGRVYHRVGPDPGPLR